MKKQTLFNLSLMSKLILSITLIVMIGALFGAMSYLLKAPKTDLPIVNPVIEAQCEIDSDCKLAYMGSNICLPCDTSIEEYKCLSLEEAKKIEEERFKRMVDGKIFCERCLEKPQHTCECENGKCEKVKEESIKEVIITTDKMEYEQRENVKIVVENNSDKSIEFNYRIEKIKEGKISTVYIYGKKDPSKESLGLPTEIPPVPIPANSVKEFLWNQEDIQLNIRQTSGIYRVKATIIVKEYEVYTVISENKSIIYSNEFTIKEKSALDPRCGEKVKIIGDCDAEVQGYEFNSDAGKCIVINDSGCSVETPFSTLEECQEVCEEKKNIVFPDKNELTKCNNNSDCVLVNSNCCGCSMGGEMTCINKKYIENWNQRLSCQDEVERDCPAVYLCDDNPTGCECVDNVCQGIKG